MPAVDSQAPGPHVTTLTRAVPGGRPAPAAPPGTAGRATAVAVMTSSGAFMPATLGGPAPPRIGARVGTPFSTPGWRPQGRSSRAGWEAPSGPRAISRSSVPVTVATKRWVRRVTPCPQAGPRRAHTQRMVPVATTPDPLAVV